MTWLRRTLRLEEPGTERPVDPATVVHVATLPLWQTPMIVNALENAGLVATFAEMSSPKYTMIGIPTAHIYVTERNRRAAEAMISELAKREPRKRRRVGDGNDIDVDDADDAAD